MKLTRKHTRARILAFVAVLATMTFGITIVSSQDWGQWGHDPQHTGAINSAGQKPRNILANLTYDPFVEQEKADPNNEEGSLAVHYQAALVDGNDVFMSAKTGEYTSLFTWETQIWNERKFSWAGDNLVQQWNFESDWKPVPNGDGVLFFEPVFHGALSGNFIYVPGAGGTVFKVRKSNGNLVARLNPFNNGEGVIDNIFLVSPISVDANGNIYYTAIKLRRNNPWFANPVNSWLVKITPNGNIRKERFTDLALGETGEDEQCEIGFPGPGALPPAPDAVAPTYPCGTVRPAVNAAPAIAPDGTIVVVARNHFVTRSGYIIAINPDLTPKWTASTRNVLNDGCNVTIPPNGTPGGCRAGTTTGVDPETNTRGSGRVNDNSSASPVIAPDGSVIYGSHSRYNYAQGHLLRYSSTGQFRHAYPFGWDVTPAIYKHGSTYSIITKENRYNVGSYCADSACPSDRNTSNPGDPEAYYITQLTPSLHVEWQYKNTNTLTCTRNPDNSISCVNDKPFSFEWCVNGVAVDKNGVVYANAEDGDLYAINQGGTLRKRLFMKLGVRSAYTPTTLGADGKIYTQQNGELFVLGN